MVVSLSRTFDLPIVTQGRGIEIDLVKQVAVPVVPVLHQGPQLLQGASLVVLPTPLSPLNLLLPQLKRLVSLCSSHAA